MHALKYAIDGINSDKAIYKWQHGRLSSAPISWVSVRRKNGKKKMQHCKRKRVSTVFPCSGTVVVAAQMRQNSIKSTATSAVIYAGDGIKSLVDMLVENEVM